MIDKFEFYLLYLFIYLIINKLSKYIVNIINIMLNRVFGIISVFTPSVIIYLNRLNYIHDKKSIEIIERI